MLAKVSVVLKLWRVQKSLDQDRECHTGCAGKNILYICAEMLGLAESENLLGLDK